MPIPQQIDKFWTSASNKSKLELFARDVAIRDIKYTTLVLSGMVVDGEVLPAQLFEQPEGRHTGDIAGLSGWLEEADARIIPHTNWTVEKGCERVVVLSNDTDSVVLLLRYMEYFMNKHMNELWVQYGVGTKRRVIPLHTLCRKLGAALCQVLVKAHISTGDDTVSKFGTKHSAITSHPEMYLANFAESDDLDDYEIQTAERYLVQVWSGSRSKTTASTFDELRLQYHTRRTAIPAIDDLPPTSSVVRGHITRSFFVVRGAITLLDDITALDPTNFGWSNGDGCLKPKKHLKRLPVALVTTCNCGGRCESNRCSCRACGIKCVSFCHKKIKRLSKRVTTQSRSSHDNRARTGISNTVVSTFALVLIIHT